MANRVSATDLARKLGDVLGRIRYRGETFVIEKHNAPIAQIGPVPGVHTTPLREVARLWITAGDADTSFADDLERIGASDQPPTAAWDS